MDLIMQLKEELRITKETNLAVVRRLQKRVDDLEAQLSKSQEEESSSTSMLHSRYEEDAYHAQNLADACGGYGGERI